MDRELPSKSPSKLSNCQKTDRVAVGPGSRQAKRSKLRFCPAKKTPVSDRGLNYLLVLMMLMFFYQVFELIPADGLLRRMDLCFHPSKYFLRPDPVYGIFHELTVS